MGVFDFFSRREEKKQDVNSNVERKPKGRSSISYLGSDGRTNSFSKRAHDGKLEVINWKKGCGECGHRKAFKTLSGYVTCTRCKNILVNG